MTATTVPEVDLFGAPIAKPPLILDRSTGERFSICPFQGWAVAAGKCITGGPEASAGSEGHAAISKLTADFVAGHIVRPGEGKAQLEEYVRHSRPDVQPDAIRGIAASMWSLCESLMVKPGGEPRSPEDVLAFDGGEGKQSGQLAWDLDVDGKTIRITGEADLILATASAEEVELIDYKTGRSEWTADDVSGSFQLGCWYPALVLLNYPNAKAVRVRVWNTRSNVKTGYCRFERGRWLSEALARITSVCRLWLLHKDGEPGPGECWPSLNACTLCPAKLLCPLVKVAVGDKIAPERLLAQRVAAQAQVDELDRLISIHTDKHGDLSLPAMGVGAGRNKPVKRRANFAVYDLEGK